MKSIIDQLYADHYSGEIDAFFDDPQKQKRWERSSAFYDGFCMGANLMMEILRNLDLGD